MIIHWTTIRSPHKPEYSQPEPDVLAVMGAELDFTDRKIAEYDIPEDYRDYVQRAWREGGVLHLQLLAHTREALFADRTIDYGEREELSWSVVETPENNAIDEPEPPSVEAPGEGDEYDDRYGDAVWDE